MCPLLSYYINVTSNVRQVQSGTKYLHHNLKYKMKGRKITDNSFSSHRVQPITSDNQTEVENRDTSVNEDNSFRNHIR